MNAAARRLLAIFGALAALALAAWFAKDAFLDEAGWVWRDAAVELRPVRGLKGITLGESLAEVSARAGAFDLDPPVAGKADSAPGRTYLQRNGRIRLRVVDERVTRVSYECREFFDETRLNRIECGASQFRIVEVFGQGARRLCARVDASAPDAAQAQHASVFDVRDTGTRYVALEGRVRGLIVMEPSDLGEALGGDQLWHRCD